MWTQDRSLTDNMNGSEPFIQGRLSFNVLLNLLLEMLNSAASGTSKNVINDLIYNNDRKKISTQFFYDLTNHSVEEVDIKQIWLKCYAFPLLRK